MDGEQEWSGHSEQTSNEPHPHAAESSELASRLPLPRALAPLLSQSHARRQHTHCVKTLYAHYYIARTHGGGTQMSQHTPLPADPRFWMRGTAPRLAARPPARQWGPHQSTSSNATPGRGHRDWECRRGGRSCTVRRACPCPLRRSAPGTSCQGGRESRCRRYCRSYRCLERRPTRR